MARRRRNSAGSVERLPRPNGRGNFPGWYIRYVDAWGVRHREKGGNTKEAAQALLRKRLDEKDIAKRTGERPVQFAPFSTIKDRLVAHWRANLTPATLRGRSGIIEKVVEHFGDKPIAHVTSADVSHWLTGLRLEGDGRKAATIRHYAAVLSSIFEFCIELGVADRNPARGLKLPKADRRQVRYITDEQRRNLYSHMPARVRLLAMLLGDAGLRRGEAEALTWDAFGPKFVNVTVVRSKNHKPRVVPLMTRTQEALRAQWDAKTTPLSGPDRLFDLASHEINKLFRVGADAAGMPWMTPHVLRHCYASWLAQRGAALTEIARLLGHADIQMAARYAQWAPNDSGARAVRLLEGDTGAHGQAPLAMGGS